MSETAICVDQLSKAYHIWSGPSARLTGALAGKLAGQKFLPRFLKNRLAHQHEQACRQFHALREVTFEVRKGETVGIIGRNGSGKSTLLQVIAGTLQPTSGKVEVRGRVAALLELGAGFNPEFSGRENVLLNAAIVGLSKADIHRRFDSIAAFADIGDFIEQPVKTYSSGMLVRLAFAVQTAMDPEILIVDEALAVGDEPFQRKCFARLEKLRSQGVTILFCSHAMGSVQNLCQRVFCLHRGEVILRGSPKYVISRYMRFCHAPARLTEEVLDQIRAEMRDGGESVAPDIAADTPEGQHSTAVSSPDAVDSWLVVGKASNSISAPAVATPASAAAPKAPPPRGSDSWDPLMRPVSTLDYDSHGARILNVHLTDDLGQPANLLRRRRWYRYRFEVSVDAPCNGVSFSMLIKSKEGLELGGARALPLGETLNDVRPGEHFRIEFRFQCLLGPGYYFLNAGIEGEVGGTQAYLHRILDAAMFKVIPEPATTNTAIFDFKVEPNFQRFSQAPAAADQACTALFSL